MLLLRRSQLRKSFSETWSCKMHLFAEYINCSPKEVKAEASATAADDERYEMAIRFKKDEDFSGWYTDVRIALSIQLSLILADRI